MVVFCDACDASNPGDGRFCQECGAPLGESPRQPAADKIDRAQANRELGKARRVLRRVKNLYIVLTAIAALSAVLLGFVAGSDAAGEARGLLWTMFAGQLAMTGLLLAGTLLLHRNPFVWGVVLAAVQTLNVATALAFGDSLPLLDIALAIGCWCAAAMLTNVNKLVAKYPELRASRRIMGERYQRSGERGEIGSRMAEKRAAERRHRLVIAGGAIAVVVIAILAFKFWPAGNSDEPRRGSSQQQVPSAPLDPVLDRFAAAWQARDLPALGKLYPPRMAARGARLSRRFKKHGMTGFPELGTARVESVGIDKRHALYETADGPVTVVFQFEQDQWFMVALRF